MAGESQKVVNVIRQAVGQMIGDQVVYTPGVIDSVQANAYDGGYVGASLLLARRNVTTDPDSLGYTASAYIRGDELLEDILIPAGAYVTAGDYISVAISDSGRAWVDRIIPNSIYSRMVMDYNKGTIGFSNGADPDLDFGKVGSVLVSAGDSDTARWQPFGYDDGPWTPTFTWGGSSTGWSWLVSDNEHTKIGNTVIANFKVNITAKGSSTGDFLIGGLPYAGVGVFTLGWADGFDGVGITMHGYVYGDTCTIYRDLSVKLNDTNFSGDEWLSGTLIYQT